MPRITGSSAFADDDGECLGGQRTWMARTTARSKASSPRPAMTDRRQDPGKVRSCDGRALPSAVMPGLVPAIHVLAPGFKNVDGRVRRPRPIVRLVPPSYPAKAGYPVRCGFGDRIEMPGITGSSAFADDDGEPAALKERGWPGHRREAKLRRLARP